MKSGFRRGLDPSAKTICCDISLSVFPVLFFASGKCESAFLTSFARFSWCDSSARIGWMPRYSRESAVTFSRKCIFAAPVMLFGFFSTIATEVSSLAEVSKVSWNSEALMIEARIVYQEVSIAKVRNPL